MNAADIKALAVANAAPAELVIGECFLITNQGDFELKDAVWTRESGLFGSLRGMVVKGGEVNRIMWVRSYIDLAGKEHRFGVSLCSCRQHSLLQPDLRPMFDLQTCG